MKSRTKNIAASVHQQLLNIARASGRPFKFPENLESTRTLEQPVTIGGRDGEIIIKPAVAVSLGELRSLYETTTRP